MSKTLRTFEYAVVGPDGRSVTGRIEAPDESAVAARLRQLNLVPTAIDEIRTSGMQREMTFSRGRKAGEKEVAVAVRQLATMVRAGLPLPRALQVLVAQAETPALQEVLRDLATEVEGGASLATAMEQHGRVFPPLTRSLVAAGEVGGFLDRALASAAAGMDSALRLRRTIKGAMVYPVVVLCIALAAALTMLLFIVPVFEEIFDGLGVELPFFTQMLVTLSDVLRVVGLPLAALIGWGAWWWRRHRRDLAVRERVEPRLLRLPVVGKLVGKLAVARLTRNLATMASCGVPLAQALDVVGPTAGNVVLEQAAAAAGDSVRNGEPLAESLEQTGALPPLAVHMVAVGEDSGELESMLASVADFYDEEVTSETEALTNALEPILLVVIGVVVGGMLIALYLPILTVSSSL